MNIYYAVSLYLKAVHSGTILAPEINFYPEKTIPCRYFFSSDKFSRIKVVLEETPLINLSYDGG